MSEERQDKRYLGDGVYADFDGFHIVLTTEGGTVNHVIYLAPDVTSSLIEYNKHIHEKYSKKEGE